MFGKIEKERLVIAGKVIKTQNGWISNPTDEQYFANGWKVVEYGTKPTYDREENKLTEEYIEDNTKIYVEYVIDTITDEEHNAVIQSEILEEESKQNARYVRGAISGDSYAISKLAEIENKISQLRAKLR